MVWKARNLGLAGVPLGMSPLVGFVDLCGSCLIMLKKYTSHSISVRETFLKCKQLF